MSHTNTPALLAVLEASGRAGVAICLWGDPGIGKSSLVSALARHHELPCETVLGSLREPSDFAGLPVVTDQGVRFDPPTWARRLASAEEGGYLFLDELSTATPAVQKAMLAVVLDRRVGDLTLPSRTRIIAAANDPDRAADGWDLAPPLANRFLHVDYRPDVTDWLDGIVADFPMATSDPLTPLNSTTRAIARGTIAGFLRLRQDLVHCYPTDEHQSGRAWASRRTWTMLADLLAQLTTDTARELAAAGLVGEGPAHEFLTWLANADLPDPEAVIEDPENTVDWGALTPDKAWALLAGVVALSTGGTKAAWTKGWKPLAVAAEHGLAAVAAAHARAMLLARPENTKPPASVKRFAPALSAAGLL